MRFNAGNAFTNASVSGVASRRAARNWALMSWNSDARLVACVNCSMNGRVSVRVSNNACKSSSGTNCSALGPIIFKSPL
ncbi:MAG: hypothetical protein BWX84_01860 [Verrucomicrobia bacterium ADurb.Bin118]|nr:MAG: hypothetical protein BWX84_01860 [Verrucomicrobia bacterium ADurb.Bin118]